ncbi:hypothetical protein [Candidatus Electronema sp. JM]|uniref:hypothetical protein n=1 Tax=Candidatus Electronema sp. JM TaxID=3401571 RepID=UPI003AA8370D
MSSERADQFLSLIKRAQRGRLKIYLGYAAGVGKTCQMLLEGHRLREDGIDVVIGMVETHGRAETEALTGGLELLPRRTVSYRGISIGEMDVDALLVRKPAVALVDELAAHQRPGQPSRQALAGCGGPAGCGHPCHLHAQRPASGEPLRDRGAGYWSEGARAHP